MLYSLKAIVGRQDLAQIEAFPFNGIIKYIYVFICYIMFFITPILTTAWLVSFLGDIGEKIRYLLHISKKAYVFSELNENALSIANGAKKQDKHAVLVFCDTKKTDADLLIKARKLGGVCLYKSCTDFHIGWFRKSYNFYLISDNEDIFDSDTVIDTDGKTRINKSFDEIQNGKFVASILGGTADEKDYKGFIKTSLYLDVKATQKTKKRKSSLFASENRFINLYDFATAIHASYLNFVQYSKDTINEEFGKLPLEFRVSNIQQAKSYGAKLELINCFYSSKDLDYPTVEDFEDNSYGNYGSDNFGFLCREEHCRWVKEKISFGWQFGEKGKDFKSIEERNAKKLHNCIVPYELLSEEDKKKDALMIRNIIPMLKTFGNGIRIYSFRNGRKPDLVVAGTGHRYFNENRDKLKEQIKKELLKYSESYRVIVRTSYAYGADQLIAECANELGIATKASLPMPHDEFLKYVWQDALEHGIEYTEADDMRLRLLLAQTVVCKHIKGTKDNLFEAAARYNIGGCDRLIALWDGEELPRFSKSGKPINRGGTYDSIFMAKEKGMREGQDICVIRCHR